MLRVGGFEIPDTLCNNLEELQHFYRLKPAAGKDNVVYNNVAPNVFLGKVVGLCWEVWAGSTALWCK